RVEAVIERGARAAQGLDAERRHDVGGQEESLRILEHQTCRTGHEVGPVENAQRILGTQLDGLEAGGAQRLRTAAPLALPENISLPDEHQADVRGWGEGAAGPERPLLG